LPPVGCREVAGGIVTTCRVSLFSAPTVTANFRGLPPAVCFDLDHVLSSPPV